MTVWPILVMALKHENDIVAVRQRARRIADLLGFDIQDQTRIATSVSEIARNAHGYAHAAKVEFTLDGCRAPERFVIHVSDRGPGIVDVEAVLNGARRDPRGLGLGISGARRLMDDFDLESAPGEGVRVRMGKALPGQSRPGPERLAEISRALTADAATDPLAELRAQNQELMISLDALESRRLEAAHLGEELERTNKGVVALYAELDRRAGELQALNATLEERVAAAVDERKRVEENLRQSQKMEAVGQLTGGIAHDFNNLLMIIGGSLEMLRRRVPHDPTMHRLLDAASQSVVRGGRLNQQLLAFARRQDLREEVICVDDIVPSLHELIERAVGEDVKIQIRSDSAPWFCRTDPHQLETAVLNLAINARDAMPAGGVLVLSTANRVVDPHTAQAWEAQPGEYVVVSVSDTGAGMSGDIVKRVFEPFFTTKEIGRGTGLGLSQVYGFAKQCGGFVSISSLAGRGTEVTIHLPRTSPPKMQQGQEPTAAGRVEGHARILVVEDDSAVRAITSEMLRELGYTVFQADTGRSALDAIASQPIDLVFSDVILPDGISGVDLAREVQAIAPNTHVLLTSGYTAQRLNLLGQGERLAVLHKPYNETQLSEAISAALASPDPD